MAAACAIHNGASTEKSIVILDDDTSGRSRLAQSFKDLGYGVVTSDTIDEVLASTGGCSPDIMLVEPCLLGRSRFEVLRTLRNRWPGTGFAFLTSAPSIACAVRAIREGAATYLTKPATAVQILRAIQRTEHDVEVEAQPRMLTLDCAIWEYMSEVVETAGSISEASRRLGVERRSLRRMLVKYAPKC